MIKKPFKIFEKIKESSTKLGLAELPWIKDRREPQFVSVEKKGAGPELLLLHGLLGALSNWDSALSFLERFCSPIALHFPILSSTQVEVRVKALAAYTEYFIRSRKREPISICGNSLGGHVALRLCLASPDIVDCLILSGASGLYEHSVDALPVRPDRSFIREHMGRVFFDKRFVTDEAVEDIYNILSKRSNVLNLIHAARSAKRDNLQDLLNQVGVPTLLLWGEDDEITTTDVAEVFHKSIPNSKLVTIKGCGHAPMIEHPQQFAKEIERFLKREVQMV